MEGDYFFDQKISLPKSDINNKLIFSLIPIRFLNTDKNISDWEINLNNSIYYIFAIIVKIWND